MKTINIDVSLEVNTALCIGSGVSTSKLGIDKLTMKDKDGNLIIPASTFKGRLRSRCERILGAMKIELCQSPNADNMCPHYFLKKDKNEKERYCPICNMFGSPWRESPLLFEDLVCKESDYEGFNTEIRSGTAISRRRGVVDEQKLFFTETSLSNAHPVFKGKIRGKINDDKELALLYLGLNEIQLIGSGKTSGLGWCKVCIEPKCLTTDQIAEAMRGWKNE